MAGYRIVPHTSEVGLWMGGKTWKEFFENAARGLFSIYGIEEARGPLQHRAQVSLRAETPEELVVDWLGELIFLVSTECWAPTEISFRSAGRGRIEASLEGRPLDSSNPLRLEIKAAAYHGLKVARKGGLWTAAVILDV